MMKFKIQDGIPFVDVQIIHCGHQVSIDQVLIDTGSATSLFSADLLENSGIIPSHDDQIHRMVGVGGYEYVVQKTIDIFVVDNTSLENVAIQLGDMNYGFHINGIIGSDVLLRMNAVIDLGLQTLVAQR